MKRQRGATMWTWMAVLAVIGFAGLVAAKVVPIYLNAFSVRSAVEGLAEDPALRGVGREELRATLFKRLEVNNISDVKRENVKFSDVAGGTEVVVEYEVRTNIIGNFDGVAHFREQAVVPR